MLDIREIDIADFDRVFPVRPTVYDSARFNLLNAARAERLVALAGFAGDGTPAVGQIFGLRGGMLRAPFSAPFSAASVADESRRGKLVSEFFAEAPRLLGAPMRLVWPSEFYGAGTPPDGSEIIDEANFHYDMSAFTDYEAHLSRSGRYNHHRALKHDFEFFKTDDIARAYAVIEANRRAMGYPLAMSLEQVVATVTDAVRADFFVMTLDGADIASAMIYEAAPGIMQVIYWGDLPQGRPARAMNHLAWRVFGWYALNRPEVRIVDIGPASTDGVRNEGLCQFKLSIGCVETPRRAVTLGA